MTKHIPGRLVIPQPVEAGETGFSQEQVDRFHADRLERLAFPDDQVAMQRLRDVFEIATPEELNEGLTWYDAAHNFCISLAEEFPQVLSTAHAAGIVASLSPSRSWDGNRALAIQFLRGERVRCLGWSLRDATDILKGQNPDECCLKEG